MCPNIPGSVVSKKAKKGTRIYQEKQSPHPLPYQQRPWWDPGFSPYPAIKKTAPQPHWGGVRRGHQCPSNKAIFCPHGVIEVTRSSIKALLLLLPRVESVRPTGDYNHWAVIRKCSNFCTQQGPSRNQDFHYQLAVTREYSLSLPEQCQRKPKNKI